MTQRTGEDWRGVSLRLSTGVPRAANMVDPGTWEVGLAPQLAEQGLMSDNLRAARESAKLAQAADHDPGQLHA